MMSLLNLSRPAAFITLALGLSSLTFADNYVADTDASTLVWKGSKVTGFHEGTVSLISGIVEIVDGALKGGRFEIDLGSINTTDLSGGKKRKLDGHLKSKDFFSVKSFPTAQLAITNVSADAEKSSFNVDADLTVKGISKPVSFTAILKENGDSIEAWGKVLVDRSKYAIKFKSGSFFENLGDKLIHDEFEVDVKLVLKKG